MNKNLIRIALVIVVIAVIFLLVPTEKQQTSPERTEKENRNMLLQGKSDKTGEKNKVFSAHLNSTISKKPISELSRKDPRKLWKSIPQQEKPASLPDNVEVEFIQMPDGALQNLQVGEKIDLLIPQKGRAYVGTVKKTSSRFSDGNVKVSSGPLDNGQDFSSFSIVEGDKITLVTVATGAEIYQVEIDNKTGVGTVLDDRELQQFRQGNDNLSPPAKNKH